MSGRPAPGVVFFLPRIIFAIVDIVFLALTHVLLAKAVKSSKPLPPDGLVLPELFLFILNVVASWLSHATYESREYIASYGMYGDGMAGNGIENRKSISRRLALLSYICNVILDAVSFAVLAATSSWFAANGYTGTPWRINLACCLTMARILVVDLRFLYEVYRSPTKTRRIVEDPAASDEEISLYSDDDDDERPTHSEEEEPMLADEGRSNLHDSEAGIELEALDN